MHFKCINSTNKYNRITLAKIKPYNLKFVFDVY